MRLAVVGSRVFLDQKIVWDTLLKAKKRGIPNRYITADGKGHQF